MSRGGAKNAESDRFQAQISAAPRLRVISSHALLPALEFQGGRDGTLWYYEAVADALARRHHSALTRDLLSEVEELQQLADQP